MRDKSYRKAFDNSVWAHRDDWPQDVQDMLGAVDDMDAEIKHLEHVLARKVSFRDAVVKSAHDEAKEWFDEQALEVILNG